MSSANFTSGGGSEAHENGLADPRPLVQRGRAASTPMASRKTSAIGRSVALRARMERAVMTQSAFANPRPASPCTTIVSCSVLPAPAVSSCAQGLRSACPSRSPAVGAVPALDDSAASQVDPSSSWSSSVGEGEALMAATGSDSFATSIALPLAEVRPRRRLLARRSSIFPSICAPPKVVPRMKLVVRVQ